MNVKGKKYLLLENNLSIEDIRYKAYNNIHRPDCPSDNYIASRSRGTKIVRREDGYDVIGWQRTNTRMQKRDIDLSVIITLSLDNDKVIRSIHLDPNFTGSMGIVCSYKYLTMILQKRLIGLKLDIENLSYFSVKNLYCFHFQEILLGAMSFVEQFKTQDKEEFDEVETSEGSYYDDGNFNQCSTQQFSNGFRVNWELIISDYKKHIKYGANGGVEKVSDLNLCFRYTDSEGKCGELTETISADTNKAFIEKLFRFFAPIADKLSKEISICNNMPYYNTNTHVGTLMSLILQGMAGSIFSQNYTYIQHVIKALQRPNGKPLCVGVSNDPEEAKEFFEGFEMKYLY
ncbi:hypothetical protein [Clostridium sp. DJ247]|uniref:hypothetical protein n=1 Tax=Clostridium sp. DJ247 TaxID=2726188 RepID=UPI0016235130|nr:hypothetical protein [Clostridium sp. DJ247]MBC2580396.1 hypothetical protein [Clostridium sp. DJ247]